MPGGAGSCLLAVVKLRLLIAGEVVMLVVMAMVALRVASVFTIISSVVNRCSSLWAFIVLLLSVLLLLD